MDENRHYLLANIIIHILPINDQTPQSPLLLITRLLLARPINRLLNRPRDSATSSIKLTANHTVLRERPTNRLADLSNISISYSNISITLHYKPYQTPGPGGDDLRLNCFPIAPPEEIIDGFSELLLCIWPTLSAAS